MRVDPIVAGVQLLSHAVGAIEVRTPDAVAKPYARLLTIRTASGSSLNLRTKALVENLLAATHILRLAGHQAVRHVVAVFVPLGDAGLPSSRL